MTAVPSRVRRAVQLLRSPAAVYLVASVVGRIGSIVLIPLYTRRLSSTDYGTYGLALTLLSLLPLCLSCGLTAGLTKEFYDAPNPEAARARVGSIAKGMLLVSSILATLLAAVIILFLPDGIGALSKRQLLLVDAAAVGTCASFVPDSFLRAAQRPRPVVALQLGMFAVSTGLGIFLVAGLDRGVDGAIEAASGTAVLSGVIGVLFTVFYLGGEDVLKTTRRVLGFSIAFVPHFIASWAQDVGDRWLLSTYGGGRALGPYYLAGQMLSPVPMVVASWNSSENPRVGEVYRAGGLRPVLADVKRQYRSYGLAALVPALGIVVASPLVAPFIGAELRSALTLLPFLALAYVIDALYYPGANTIFYTGRSRAIPITTALSAGTGLLVAYFMLRAYGLAGLVAARVVTSTLRATLIGAAARLTSTASLRDPAKAEAEAEAPAERTT